MEGHLSLLDSHDRLPFCPILILVCFGLQQGVPPIFHVRHVIAIRY
jgi:hypothetical protein